MKATSKAILAALVALLAISSVYFFTMRKTTGSSTPQVAGTTLTVFHAGSLTGFVEDMGKLMEQKYGVTVYNEPSGSVDVIRKVVDLGKPADIVMSADYRLISSMMLPSGHASWNLVFASNEMVIVFTDSSKYADEINEDNWLEILLRPDVRVGFSDPNRDPCGYRTLMVFGLASLKYGTTEPLEMLAAHAGVVYELKDGEVWINVSAGVNPDSEKIFIRDKSVDLISLVESGIIDYAFEYRNVAVSHNLSYVALPKEVNLADPSLDSEYSRVKVTIMGSGGKIKTLTASSIAYGMTIPSNPPNPDAVRLFVELLLSDEGRQVLTANGFRAIEPTLLGENPPDWLIELVRP